jgi:hypothetical protein
MDLEAQRLARFPADSDNHFERNARNPCCPNRENEALLRVPCRQKRKVIWNTGRTGNHGFRHRGRPLISEQVVSELWSNPGPGWYLRTDG